jgi:hypothetical protein
LYEKTLARAVPSHDETERRAALADDLNVVEERLDFVFAADGYLWKPNARHQAAFQRVQDGLRNAFGDFDGVHLGYVCFVCGGQR